MPRVCMASAVDAALVDMQGIVFWTIIYCVHWTRHGFNPLKNQQVSFDQTETSRRRNVDSIGQRTMPHMGCNSSGYILDFTHCVNFLYTRRCSRTRCDAQETKIRGSVTNKWIETSGVFNSQGLEFVKKIESRISNASSDKKETEYLFQRISVAIQRETVSHFLDLLINVTISGSPLQWEASKSNRLWSTFEH